MTAAEKQLFQLLNERSFQRGTFRLASGTNVDRLPRTAKGFET